MAGAVLFVVAALGALAGIPAPRAVTSAASEALPETPGAPAAGLAASALDGRPEGDGRQRQTPRPPTRGLPLQDPLAPERIVHEAERLLADVGEDDEPALSPKLIKQINKLTKKIAKKGLQIVKQEGLIGTLQEKLLAAQYALIAALSLPESSLKAVLAKSKAMNKAGKLLAKLQKKLAKAYAKLELQAAQQAALEEQLASLESGSDDPDGGGDGGGGGGDGGGSQPSGLVSVPLLVQPALPKGASGLAYSNAVATFGIPFAEGEVPLASGRPALAVSGSSRYQFRALDTWPDGSVRWALVDLQTSVASGGIDGSTEITGGSGTSAQAALGSESGNLITLNTGALVADIAKTGFNLFDRVRIDGTDVIVPHQSAGILGLTSTGQILAPKAGTVTVVLEENGPARAVVRATGTLATLAGTELLDFTCRITARAGSADLNVDFTLRNATLARPRHVQLDGLGLVLRAAPGGASPTARIARHNGFSTHVLAPGQSALLYQAYSSAPTTAVLGNGPAYLPPIPKLEGGSALAEEGYELVVAGQTAHALGNRAVFPAHGWANLSGSTGGVTVALRQMPYLWPASLELSASGDVVAGLWPARNAAGFTINWRQHESRTCVFSFHLGAPVDPELVARRLDAPLVGRAADYAQYGDAGVFPYRLLTLAEQNQIYALLDLDHAVTIHNDTLSITRFLAASTTGGANNHDSIERRLVGEWLRHGHGGQYLGALDLALYKSEWQILRSDDFLDEQDPGAQNSEIPHSKNYGSDLEHRYRDGMLAAWWLTGDARFRDALLDEEEILRNIYLGPQERSMYQTLRAMALIGRFTGSTILRDKLKARLAYFCNPTLDVNSGASGFGWQSSPGSGSRRYFVNSSQGTAEKPAGENYITRGFITASLGPLGMYHAWQWLSELDPADPDAALARSRLTDLAFYTRKELFPFFANPADRHLVYSWAVKLQQVVTWEQADFHPILLGMAEAWRQTGDASYLAKGIEQIEAFRAHDQGPYDSNMYVLDSRLDVQHFLAVLRDWVTGQGP